MQQSTVPRCAILSVGSTGVPSTEAARVHIACRRRGGGVATDGARAADCADIPAEVIQIVALWILQA
jgi:hypothetical protein